MCGIAGIMTRNGRPPARSVLDILSRALAHRGPDGEGFHLAGDTGLVHRRLAIIDLVSGDQPLIDSAGAALVANGEIYNYVELGDGLPQGTLRTHSDCELPLALYRRAGLDFVDSLRGMYALAIHDPATDTLVLARDPFGIKPLYYVEAAAGFAFASEPQALIAAGLATSALDPAHRGELLQLQFTTGHGTIFRDVKRVLPGELLVVRGGRVIERHHRTALPEGAPQANSEAEALRRLDAVIEDSVLVHQRSDVPYGMFLSGGIDSGLLLATMARLNDRPVCAFTAGFVDGRAADERGQAKAVAAALGAEHVEIEIGEADFWQSLPQIAAAMDDPAADYAIVPTYLLAAEARKRVKTVLCGEGGDELFGGYGRYRSALRPWWRGGRPMRPRGVLDGLNLLRQPARGWRDGITAAEIAAARDGRSRLQIAQATDIADWLPNDLLIKLDRCLMAHGLEGRTPYLDPAVAAVAFSLPDDLKVRRRTGKWLLRRLLADRLPEAHAFERKRGFTVPVADWIAHSHERLAPLVARQPGVAELCEPRTVEKVFATRGKHEGFAAWTLLFYALWHRRHVLGLAPEGDVFDCLESGRG
ncbi:MAG: asparagine synthase (glutamine-hydrolyzing) [Rhodospirillaceae bacterium]|nr:asparagine synthase (glutamine-hydrolyzing) [Rhodospirillaceae bacterium]